MDGQKNRLSTLLEGARAQLDRLTPTEALAATHGGALIVDTRPEFQRRADGEIPGAIVIERNHLEWRLFPGGEGSIPEASHADVQWIVVCDEGYSSSLAAATLRELGLRRATDLIGGFQAWRAAGLPVETGRAPSTPRLYEERRATTTR